MRIVQIAPVYPFRGGIAHFAGCLHRELVKQGHISDLISFKKQYPPLLFPGKSQTETNRYFSDLPSKRLLTPYNPFTFLPTFREIERVSPDYVIFHFFIPFFVPAFLFISKKLQKVGIKIIIAVHNIEFHEKWLFANRLTLSFFRTADSIVTFSEAVKQSAESLFGNSKRSRKPNIIALFHPLYEFHNQNRYTSEEAKQLLNLSGKRVVLFFGYIKPYKGLDILIKSFPLIKKRFPDATLLIAGEIYGNVEYYTNLIEQTSLQRDIILRNEYVSDDGVELYFKAADLLAVPYRQATQSGVIQTAYAMNVGVVVTPVGGLPEMVIDKQTGIIAQSVNERDFAEAVTEYFSLETELVQRRIADFKQNMSWTRFVQELIKKI